MRTLVTICGMLASVLCLAEEGITGQQATALAKKLDAIIIPAIEFNQTHINDVVMFLTAVSKQHDPAKVGVSIILMDRESQAEISLNLSNVSLHRVLKLVAEKAGLLLDLEGQSVILRKAKDKN